jgi:hypothetical protein
VWNYKYKHQNPAKDYYSVVPFDETGKICQRTQNIRIKRADQEKSHKMMALKWQDKKPAFITSPIHDEQKGRS